MAKPAPLPTRKEIERACLEIQLTWSPETEAERRCGGVVDLVAVPIYSIRNGRRGEVLAETVQ